MKLKAALSIFLVIFATTVTFFAFKVSNVQSKGMTFVDSIKDHRILQIDNATIDPKLIDTPGGPG
jgi:hypothetical protein